MIMKASIILTLCFIRLITVEAQEIQRHTGILLSAETGTPLSGVNILNLRTKTHVLSDQQGDYTIVYQKGDSVEFRHSSLETKTIAASNLKDSIFIEKKHVLLEGVVVTARSPLTNLKDLKQLQQAQNQKRGIYYGGRPPIALLSPFGGKPITFFYELLSKNGKKARAMEKTFQQEQDETTVDILFNNQTIKAAIPIADEELESFKQKFRPTPSQVKHWNTYDLQLYLKKSFNNFKGE